MAIFLRAPAVAGTFYDINPDMLRKQLNFSFKIKAKKPKKDIIAAIVPHAGYVYSGNVAAYVYSIVKKSNFMIVGTNHSGFGADFALMKKGLWKTPLGEIAIDEKVSDKIIENSNLIEYDVMPHEQEHSIEVQLPFLQYRFGNEFKFIPITVINEYPNKILLDNCKTVGKCIGKVLKKEETKWTLLASSDFSHYLPKEIVEKIDNYTIKNILKMNEDAFMESVNEKRASICGYGAISTVISAAKEMGAKKAELLKYSTSGDITGEEHSVVGYASIIFY